MTEPVVDQAIAAALRAKRLTRVGEELAGFVRVLLGSTRLASVLAQPNLPSEKKKAIVSDLARGKFAPETLEIVGGLSGRSLRSTDAFLSSVIDATAQAVFRDAESTGKLDAIEDALYGIGRTVYKSAALRDALTNPQLPDSRKHELIDEVFSAYVPKAATMLVHMVIDVKHGRDVDEGVLLLSSQAAERAGAVVANVTTAIELDAKRKAAFAEALTAAVGKRIKPRFDVDAAILGSAIVRFEHEVWDGSVRHQLEQVQDALAAAS